MKILSLALLLMASLAFVMVGCTDSSSPIVSPTEQTVSAPPSTELSLTKPDCFLSVTGYGYWKSIPVTGQTNALTTFYAVRKGDGSFAGEVSLKDKGPMYVGKATVYDLKVRGNIAKLAFRFTSGNLGGFYNPAVDIEKIYGWLIVIDKGGNGRKNKHDLVSMVLFTDGSDIGTGTIAGIDKMQPQEFLNWMRTYLLPLYGVSYEDYLSVPDMGSVRIR